VLEYRTDSKAPIKQGLRFLPTKPVKDKAFDLVKLDPTNGAWKTVSLELDLKGSTAGRLEFHNNETGVGGEFRVRRFVASTLAVRNNALLEPGSKREIPVAPVAAKPVIEREIVKSISFAALTEFRSTFAELKADRELGTMLPPGVSLTCWNAASVAEFRAGEVEGRTGLGFTNLNDTKSSQLLVHEVNKLIPGQRYRAKVDYLTKNDAFGKLQFRKPKENYTAFAVADLGGTGGHWKSATVDFVRPPVGVEIDLQLVNASVGEGNTLYVHTIEIVTLEDAEAPAPAGRTSAVAPPPAGTKVFGVDFVGKTPFVYIIRDKKPSLETWKVLPAGVNGLCWKNESEAEFRGADVKGKPALGMANLNDAVSSQFQFEFGEGPTSKVGGGKRYQIAIEYLTVNDAVASMSVRKPKEKFARMVQKELPGTAGEWKRATLDFTAPVGTPVDFVVENLTIGAGNTVHVASVELYEVK
jgi:hypothetical protein